MKIIMSNGTVKKAKSTKKTIAWPYILMKLSKLELRQRVTQ